MHKYRLQIVKICISVYDIYDNKVNNRMILEACLEEDGKMTDIEILKGQLL